MAHRASIIAKIFFTGITFLHYIPLLGGVPVGRGVIILIYYT